MGNMFNECSSLEEINVFNFNSGNVTNTEGMFRKSSSLKELVYQVLIQIKLLIWQKCSINVHF